MVEDEWKLNDNSEPALTLLFWVSGWFSLVCVW